VDALCEFAPPRKPDEDPGTLNPENEWKIGELTVSTGSSGEGLLPGRPRLLAESREAQQDRRDLDQHYLDRCSHDFADTDRVWTEQIGDGPDRGELGEW
jgi:hypothetical protein